MICAVLLLPGGAWAGGSDMATGEELHTAHCTRCHDAGIYTRQQRLVNDYAGLRKRVQECELGAELGWFEEEVDAVIGYLNETFYKFPAAAQ